MKRVIALVAVAVAPLALAAGFAFAQTGAAVPDGDGHPNVGALLMPRADGSLSIICSGTLVTPRVFLTASHCTAFEEENGFTRAYVTFDPNSRNRSEPRHLLDALRGRDRHQSGLQAAQQQRRVPDPARPPGERYKPAQIAPLRLLDELKQAHELNDLAYTNVGYGTSEQVVVKGSGPTVPFDGIRKVTVSGYHALDRQFIHLDQNLARDLSGSGDGDSGGPTFVDTASGPVVISVVSTGDARCTPRASTRASTPTRYRTSSRPTWRCARTPGPADVLKRSHTRRHVQAITLAAAVVAV